jgi:hypothetical protein
MGEADREMAEQAYRKLYPPPFPAFPYRRAPQLADLWPDEQERFIRQVATAKEAGSVKKEACGETPGVEEGGGDA